MDAGSNPSSPASHLAPCLWTGKAVEYSPKPWDPAPTWETWKTILASDWLSTSHCGAWGVHHGTEDLPLYLSSSLYICLSNKNK